MDEKQKNLLSLYGRKTSGWDPNEQKQQTCFHYIHIDCIRNTKNLIRYRENLFNSVCAVLC